MSSRNASADESGRGRAIVIGTGFAGAVAAMRLGEHGVDTIMLERGQAWPLRADGNTFPTVLAPDRRSAWFSALTTMTDAPRVPIGLPYAGLIERIEADGIDVAVGAGVGGGSLVYGGALVQPKQALFERVFPSAISYQEFDSIYYPRACARLRPAVVPADLLSREPYLAARQFAAHARDAGFVPQLLETGFDMSLVREELEGSKPAAAIIGEYLYGTNSGAKVGLDRTYLDAALATGNVQILPLHEVTEIAEASDGYEVRCNHITPDGAKREHKVLHAQYLFVCAGSINTSKLLVRAKARRTLTRLNEFVGSGWGNNGDVVVARAILQPTGARQAGPPAYCFEDHDNPLGPVFVTHAPTQLPLELGTLLQVGMAIPEGRGYFEYRPLFDDVMLRFPTSADCVARQAVFATIARLDSANFSLTTTLSAKRTTYHPLGGMPLGKACDLYGRVKGYQGLYVLDGALIPNGSTGCVNPSLTITAMAERCMDRILVEDLTPSALAVR